MALNHGRCLGSLDFGRGLQAAQLSLPRRRFLLQLAAEENAHRRRLPVLGSETDTPVRSEWQVCPVVVYHCPALLSDRARTPLI